MARVLAVDNCLDTQKLVERALGASCRVCCAGTVRKALERIAEETPDLVLIDLSLPDGDGFEICERLQEDQATRPVPVIILTGSDQTRDKVTAFSLGVDDYIVKPFDLAELRARVEGRLRKAQTSAEREQLLHLGGLRLDLARMRAWQSADGEERELSLTPHELRLLLHLARREGRLVTRGQLLEALWGAVNVTPRTVDTHLSNLRRKLDGRRVRIEGIRGLGYRLLFTSPDPA